jgi:hypothetical protein
LGESEKPVLSHDFTYFMAYSISPPGAADKQEKKKIKMKSIYFQTTNECRSVELVVITRTAYCCRLALALGPSIGNEHHIPSFHPTWPCVTPLVNTKGGVDTR